MLLTDEQLLTVTPQITCRRAGLWGLLRTAQPKPAVRTLSAVKLTQRTWPCAEQGMLTNTHLPAVLKTGKNKTSWRAGSLQHECHCTAEGSRGLLHYEEQPCALAASPLAMCFLSGARLFSRSWIAFALVMFECYLDLGVLVSRKSLYCWVNHS